MAIVLQIVFNGVFLSLLYALIASGVSFLYSTTRIFHLAHGAVALGAGYAFWWMFQDLGAPLAGAILFAVFTAALAGFLMNELVYEKLRQRGARGLGYLIATLALLMLGSGIILALFGAGPKTFKLEPEILNFGEVSITKNQLTLSLISILLLAVFYWLTKYTRFGKAMRATADNEVVAEILGVNTRKIRRLAFILASLLAAAAGIIYGLEFALDPNKAAILAVFGFAGAVIGGVWSFGGAIFGSFVIGLSEQAAVWYLGGGFRNAVAFILLFIFLLFKPSGIFGTKKEL